MTVEGKCSQADLKPDEPASELNFNTVLQVVRLCPEDDAVLKGRGLRRPFDFDEHLERFGMCLRGLKKRWGQGLERSELFSTTEGEESEILWTWG